METAIDIQGLEKTVAVGFWGRPKRLLHNVTLQVQTGRVFGFIGQNGAGKSTTIKHIIGAMKPSAGTLQIFGAAPSETATRSKLGYLPETPRLPANLWPSEVLDHHARLLGIPSRVRSQVVQELLHDVDIARFSAQRICTLSKGNQQRVALALALLGQPKLIVLDEPMSGLDPSGRKLVRDLIRREKNRGATVFFSSHVLSDVESLCDDVAILHEGRSLLQGSVASVLHSAEEMWVVMFAGTPTEQIIKAASNNLSTVDANLHQWQFSDSDSAWAQAIRLREQGFHVLSVAAQHKPLEERVLQILDDSRTNEAPTDDVPSAPAARTERS